MNRWEGKVAVVTGASGGIGAEIAEGLVRAGVSVVGLDRRLEKLENLSKSLEGAKGKLHARHCELRNEEEILDAFEWVKAEFGGVDILVNNAGVSVSSKIIDDQVESCRKIMEVNVLAMAICIREAVASMKSRDVDSYIININSIFGHDAPAAFLNSSFYSPSKFAVTALTETVRKELAVGAKNKIKITSISPGIVKTGIIVASGSSDAFYETLPHLDPKDIADTVLYLLGTRQEVQVTELTIRPNGETI